MLGLLYKALFEPGLFHTVEKIFNIQIASLTHV